MPWAISRASPLLMRTPSWAPLPVPTMIEVGVASPMAQGQAMTSTAINIRSAKGKGASPIKYQASPDSVAMTITMGTKYKLILSARFAMGALEPWASRTILMIRASTVSCPTRSARTLSMPFLFRVPPITLPPSSFDTGRLSPVSMDSSTLECPFLTVPSTGIRSPGRTRIMSPASISETRMSICSSFSAPGFLTRVALSGVSSIS